MDLLLSEVEGRQGALPLLEFALSRIWEGLVKEQPPARTLEEIGGVGGALAGEAERLYQALDERGQRIARRAFLGMVQLGEGAKDTRRRVEVAGLVAVDEETEEVLAVLRCFAQPGARLLTLGATDQLRDQVEVTHEALFEHWQRLRTWIEEGRADLRFHRRLSDAVEHWGKNGRLDVHLWRQPDLELLQQFQERVAGDMTADEVRFLTASHAAELARKEKERQAQEAEAQRLRAERRRAQC